MWCYLRPPRRQFVGVAATAAALWGLRLLHHEASASIAGSPAEQLVSLTVAFLGAGSLIVLAVLGAPGGRDLRDLEVSGAFAIAVMGLGADVWFRYMVSHPLPSLDRTLYAVDSLLGGQASFVAGRAFARWPAVAVACNAVYEWLPVWLVLMFVRLPKQPPRMELAWAAAAGAAGAIGYVAYRLCPAAGPKYAFPAMYPVVAPDVTPGWVHPVVMTAPLLNAFPSLHAVWALLLLAWAPALRTAAERTIVVAIALLTMVATLGLGEHYVIDLVVAVPFTAAVASLSMATRRDWRVRLLTAAVGTAVFLGWVAAIRSAAILTVSPATARLLVLATVVLPAAEPVLRLARQRGHGRDAAMPVTLHADVSGDADGDRS
jgi:hypothetical protein